MEAVEWIVASVGGLVGLAVSFRLFFRYPGDFLEALKFWLTPDIVSLFRGQWGEDTWNETKLFLWICVGIVFGVGALKILHIFV